MVLNKLLAISQGWSLSSLKIEFGKGLSDFVWELVGVLPFEFYFLLTEEGQVVVILPRFPVSNDKYFIFTRDKVDLNIKIPQAWVSCINISKRSILILSLQNESDRWVFIGILREQSFIPLTDSQVAVSVIFNSKAKSRVKSSLVFRLNSWWTVGIICIGNHDMWNEFFGLAWAQLKHALFTDIKLYLFL